MGEEYGRALKRERDRERSHRKSAQGGFASLMIICDLPTKRNDSDEGRGAEAIRGFDAPSPLRVANMAIARAIGRIKAVDPSLLEVFSLILRNGSERMKSIEAMTNGHRSYDAARKTYGRHLEKLLKIFHAQ